MALEVVLTTHRLSQNGYANTFYSAGVKSMLHSFHNFIFASFDPGGLITVDKPPLALWVQVLSAKVFGFSPMSLLLPEAIIGVLGVAAIYWAMVRNFGWLAALTGALALAVFPSFVAVSRDNGVDPLLLLLMILACGAALRAAERGRMRWLVASAILVGLAFNTKTLAAYLVVPGIACAYLVCAPESILRRVVKLLIAGVVMAVVSFSWIALVELTPASQRPFVGSSTNNTELGLTFSYNGFGRVGGEVGGPGNIPVGSGAVAKRPPRHRLHATHLRGGAPPVIGRRPVAAHRHRRPVSHAKPPEFLPNGRRASPIAFESHVGPLRLFKKGLGEQGGWIVPFALGGLIALFIGWLLNRPQATADKPDGRFDRTDPRLAGALVFGGWFLIEAMVLSLSKGIVHPYYVSALAPGAAAMAGAGAWALAGEGRWRPPLAALAIAGTVAVQITLLEKEHYLRWFIPVLIGVCALGLLASLAHRRLRYPAMALSAGALLLTQGAFSSTTWSAPVYGTFPAAGPRQAEGFGGYGISSKSLVSNLKLLRYVSSHHPGRRWALLTVASDTAAPFILLGLNAGALAGYSAIDPAMTGPELGRLVAAHQARYVVLGGAYSSRGGNNATGAVQQICREIPASAWHGFDYSIYSLVLLDCAGYERQLENYRTGTVKQAPAGHGRTLS
jgi:4-amino-4-deoxy-L-arabinose transferase-like glycosyltransferase